LQTRHLSGSDVLRFRDKALQTYYTNPRYLDSLRKKFGEETVRHIRQMTAHTLERKHA
jgi:hypothetical protein